MRSLVVVLFLGLGVSACTPRLSPPYRDYEVREAGPDSSLRGKLQEAAVEAGWALSQPTSPFIVSTRARRVEEGFLSTTDAALDLVPLDGGYVRIYVRAEKRSLLGGRSKVYALSPGLRRSILEPLSEALARRGLVALGTPRDRDEDATE